MRNIQIYERDGIEFIRAGEIKDPAERERFLKYMEHQTAPHWEDITDAFYVGDFERFLRGSPVLD